MLGRKRNERKGHGLQGTFGQDAAQYPETAEDLSHGQFEFTSVGCTDSYLPRGA